MSIKYAILGFLSWHPLSGYDLKKMFVESDFISWAGSNNQIYSTLLELQRDGLVTHEVQQPERGPARKVYTVTEQGSRELREWLGSAPELPQVRNPFLLQLAWADYLEPEMLDALLGEYERHLATQRLVARERLRRDRAEPARTARESYLWRRIGEYWIGFYENELAWVRKTREELREGQAPGSGTRGEEVPS